MTATEICKDYQMYYNLTVKMFNELKDMICQINKYSILEIDGTFISKKGMRHIYGFSSYTNNVIIFLANIIHRYDDDELTPPHIKEYFNHKRYDFICSNILYTIVHELFHMDQLRYIPENLSNVIAVKESIEKSCETETQKFIFANLDSLEKKFGFDFLAESIIAIVLQKMHPCPLEYEYRRFKDISELFSQIFNSSIFKYCYDDNIDVFQKMQHIANIMVKFNIPKFGINESYVIKINNSYNEVILPKLLETINTINQHIDSMRINFDVYERDEYTVIDVKIM